jgi:putative MATE family efflux protein
MSDAIKPSMPQHETLKSRKDRNRVILALALPMMGGMLSQNVMNLVDTGMVGTQGKTALAAVGTGSFASFMAVAIMMGLSAGVQAIASRRFGEGNTDGTAAPLNAALIVAFSVGIPISIGLYFLSPEAVPFLNSDTDIQKICVPYVQLRVLGIAAVGANFASRGFWNGINRPGYYLRSLIFMNLANIVLNYIFIFGHLGAPKMGAVGAGLGSLIATWLGVFYYFYLGFRYARPYGFLKARPSRKILNSVVRLSLPTGFQMMLFAGGYTAMFWILGLAGEDHAAAGMVLINVMLLAILPGIGMGLAAASLVGQAMGRKDTEDARRWGWDVVRIAAMVMISIGLIMAIFPNQILGVFIHDPGPLLKAELPLRIFGLFIGVDAVGLVLQHSFRGAGATFQAMIIGVMLQWGLFLPVAYIVGPVMGNGILAVWITMMGYRALQASIYAVLWNRGTWSKVKV